MEQSNEDTKLLSNAEKDSKEGLGESYNNIRKSDNVALPRKSI